MNNSFNYYMKNGAQGVLNIPKTITTRIMGEKHTIIHRIRIGVIIMIVGVGIANTHTSIMLMDLVFEGFGYTLHAIGAVPIIEHLAQIARKEESDHG